MNIPKISVSAKQTWDECRQRYKYRYILKIEPPEPEPFYFVYGKIIHKIAEEYVEQKGSVPINEIKNAVLNGEIEIQEGQVAPAIPASYQRRMPSMIRAIHSITDQVGFDGKLEEVFFVDLDPPNEIYLNGVIDRLIPRTEKLFILDYKTTKKGRWRKTQKSVRYDLQLRSYAWACQQLYDYPADKIYGALFYLEGANLISAKFDQQLLDSARDELLKTFREIKATDENKVTGRVGDHCSRCTYNSICPFVRTTNKF